MTLAAKHRAGLQENVRGALRFDEPLARRTTLRVGGPADAWLEPADLADLQRALGYCADAGIAVTTLGSGTNLLVRDGGIRGLVVATRSLRGIEREGNTVTVQAGVSTGKLLKCALGWGLGGVEFLGGVPGSVGGGLVMNAGTYLGEFKDVTRDVTSVTSNGQLRVRDNAACGFRYRHSDLPGTETVAGCSLVLSPRPRAQMEEEVRALRDRRNDREPKGFPSAGSWFKNPEGDFAGRLIEACGLKGTRVGGAEVSPAHANWLVNAERASARDFLALVERVRDEVARRHGVTLELEVKVMGESEQLAAEAT